MKITNPATGEVFKEISEDTKETIGSKFEKLKEGQRVWADVPLAKRVEVLQRFASLLQSSI